LVETPLFKPEAVMSICVCYYQANRQNSWSAMNVLLPGRLLEHNLCIKVDLPKSIAGI